VVDKLCRPLYHKRLLARSQYPEGPATDHLGIGFLGFPLFKANAEMVPKTPSCYCMLLM